MSTYKHITYTFIWSLINTSLRESITYNCIQACPPVITLPIGATYTYFYIAKMNYIKNVNRLLTLSHYM